MVVEAQTDCDFGAKVLEIPSFSVAAAVPDMTLRANARTTGLAPFSAFADTVVVGNDVAPGHS